MQIFAPDDPLVLNGTYDTEGYKPGERARIAKARDRQHRLEADRMTKKKPFVSHTRGRRPRAAAAPTPAATRRRRSPRQAHLPGTDDGAIPALEQLAHELKDVRASRIALTAEETSLNDRGVALMKAHKKTVYQHDGITINLTAEKEKIKVKIRDEDDDLEDTGDEADA